MNSKFKKFDPAVDKKFLIVLSGIMWSTVGIALCNMASGWLSESTDQSTFLLAGAGIFLAMLIHHFGFLRIVDKNIERILSKSGKVCIFGFQPWKSYLLILIMVGMGILLRHSALPKPYLAVIYIGIGGAMLLSSLRYHRNFLKLLRRP